MAHDGIIGSMKLIQDDCVTDALNVDSTPFTGKGVGENLGNLYAMVKTLARAIEILAENHEERPGSPGQKGETDE